MDFRKNYCNLVYAGLIAAAAQVLAGPALAQEKAAAPAQTLFTNVRVFDGQSSKLSDPTNVLVTGNKIAKISKAAIGVTPETTVINGTGRTLMPGLIDAHNHIMMQSLPQAAAMVADLGYINVAAVKSAHDMLMRGFTSGRDMGGPSFGLMTCPLQPYQ